MATRKAPTAAATPASGKKSSPGKPPAGRQAGSRTAEAQREIQHEVERLRRPAQPEEISPAYVFLASPVTASYINGAVLPVMGGPTG